MIVAGNSNVACLDQLGARLEVDGQPAEVCWVGALRFAHLFNGHPAGKRVRERFAVAPRAKAIAIGTHDIFDVCDAAGRGTVEETIGKLMDHAERLFAELGAMGAIAWLVFPQPRNAVHYVHLGPRDIHTVAVKVNRHLAEVALRHGVQVLDPFAQLEGVDLDPKLLQRDGQHLNADGAARVASALGAAFGVTAQLSRTQCPDAEPNDELASFCGMLLQAVGIRSGGDVMVSLIEIITERLAERGLTLEVTPELELVEAGLLDSLDLVDVYAEATRAAGLDIPFDVSLRELNTVERMATFIQGHLGTPERPSREDFERSMGAARGQLDPTAADDAHQRIAAMDPSLAQAIMEQVEVTLYGVTCPYGVVLLWMGLFTLARGDATGAAELVLLAGKVPFAVDAALVARVMEAVEAADLAAAS